MKESLIIGMMCWLICLLLEFVHGKPISISKVMLLLVFSYVVLTVKFYYFGALVVSFIPYCVVRYASNCFPTLEKNRGVQLLGYATLIVVMVFVSSFIHPLLNLTKLSSIVYQNYLATLDSPDGGSMYTFEGLSANPVSFIRHLPDALSKGLFGPFIWDCKKLISMLSGIENTVLLVLAIPFVYSLFNTRIWSSIKLIEVSVVFYILILAVFMAFSSPNWGTLVRYKVGYLPFFVLLLLNNSPFLVYLEKKWNFLKSDEKRI